MDGKPETEELETAATTIDFKNIILSSACRTSKSEMDFSALNEAEFE